MGLYEFTKILLLSETIGDLSETHQRLIGDQDAWSETIWRPRHVSSETDIPDQKPRHASSETNMPVRRPIEGLNVLHRRPTCLIGDPSKTLTCYNRDQHAWSETHQRPWHASLETDLLDPRPIGDQHICGDPPETNMPWSPIRIQTHLFKYTYFYLLFA